MATELQCYGYMPHSSGCRDLGKFVRRSQRNASSRPAAAGTPEANGTAPSQLQDVIVAYASQTGTAQEIARNIQAESSKHGIQSKVPPASKQPD